MGVYIKGMEMPTSCDECPLYTCMHNHEDCPLVPVHPHGRLGDLDAALELVMQYCPDDDGTYSKAGVDLRELLDEIESLPTIIPAEEAAE